MRRVLAAAVLVLGLAACEPGDAPTGQCPAGTMRGPDGIACLDMEEQAENNDAIPAEERAAQIREEQFDDCRNAGKDEETCLAEGGHS